MTPVNGAAILMLFPEKVAADNYCAPDEQENDYATYQKPDIILGKHYVVG